MKTFGYPVQEIQSVQIENPSSIKEAHKNMTRIYVWLAKVLIKFFQPLYLSLYNRNPNPRPDVYQRQTACRSSQGGVGPSQIQFCEECCKQRTIAATFQHEQIPQEEDDPADGGGVKCGNQSTPTSTLADYHHLGILFAIKIIIQNIPFVNK